MHKIIVFGIVLVVASATISAPIRDDLAAKGIEYIGQEQVVPISYEKRAGEPNPFRVGVKASPLADERKI